MSILNTPRGPVSYPKPLPRLRNVLPATNISEFFGLVKEVIDLHIKAFGPPEGITPEFAESFTQERLSQTDTPFEVITFKVESMKMAYTDNAGNRVPRGIQTREIKGDPTKDTYNIVEASWMEDAIVTFQVWSKTNSNANALALWFHQVMMIWANSYQYFSQRGVHLFQFVERRDDKVELKSEQEIYLRQLAYSFRLENLVKYEQKQLTDITLNVDYAG